MPPTPFFGSDHSEGATISGTELLIIYLQEIEKNPDVWNLANVYAKSGAIDVRRAEATVLARANGAKTTYSLGRVVRQRSTTMVETLPESSILDAWILADNQRRL